MRKLVLVLTAAILCLVMALLGLAILTGSVGGSAEVAACVLSNSKETSGASGGSTTTTVMSTNCGSAASVTLPSSPVVNNGLPSDYVIPAECHGCRDGSNHLRPCATRTSHTYGEVSAQALSTVRGSP